MKQPVLPLAVFSADIQKTIFLQSGEEGVFREVQMAADLVEWFHHFGRAGIDVSGAASEEKQLSALFDKCTEKLNRAGAEGENRWNDDGIVSHFSDFQRISALFTEGRKLGLAEVVKVDGMEEKRLSQFFKLPVHFLPEKGRLILGAPGEPVALNGMDNSDADHRFSAGEGRI